MKGDGDVYVLDLDQTIVGNVTYIIFKYNIAMQAETIGLLEDGKAFIRPWLVDAIKDLIRPHFADFLAHVKKRGARVFIYTSSHRPWATFVVEAVEEIIGLTFDRPLFTRENVTLADPLFDPSSVVPQGSKSMALISDAIEKAIGHKLTPERVVIVDDNLSVWNSNDVKRFRTIRCPAYRYIAFIDPFDGFYPRILNHPDIRRSKIKDVDIYNPGGSR